MSIAVQVYLAVGVSSYPTALPGALADYIGFERADTYEARVKALLKEASVDEWTSRDLAEVTRQVEANILLAHPELSDDAVRALGWYFSYSNR